MLVSDFVAGIWLLQVQNGVKIRATGRFEEKQCDI